MTPIKERLAQMRERMRRKSGHAKHFAAVRARDKDRCKLCGKRIESYYDMSLDHIVARMFGGSNDIENLQLAHKACNAKKHREVELPKARRKWSREAEVARDLRHTESYRILPRGRQASSLASGGEFEVLSD